MKEKVEKLFEREEFKLKQSKEEKDWDLMMGKLFNEWISQKNFVAEEYNMITHYHHERFRKSPNGLKVSKLTKHTHVE